MKKSPNYYILTRKHLLLFVFIIIASYAYTQVNFTQQKWIGAWGSDGPIMTGDLNGDGKTDVFMWRNSSHTWTVNLSTGTGFQQLEWTGAWGSDGPIETGDLNGDGKIDVFTWRNSSHTWTVNLSTGTGFQQLEWTGAWGSDGPIETGDLNGDGKTDVFMWRNSSHTWTVNLSTGSGFQQLEWTGAWGSDGPIETGDLNGDGKTDVFMWRNSSHTWTVNLSTGSGFQQLEWTGAWGSDGPIETGDLNGDGKTDVFMWRNSSQSWTTNISTGTGFQQQEWKGAWGSDGPIQVGDVNGDGSSDVFMWRNSDKSWTVNSSPANDTDGDNLNDNVESRLLEKYSPYLKFSHDTREEEYRPTDAIWYVEHSNLLGPVNISILTLKNNPFLIVDPNNGTKGLSSLIPTNKKTDFRLDLNIAYWKGYLNGDGHDWPEIVSKGNIGLYGHVTPMPDNSGDYKIEYWQFFAWNKATTIPDGPDPTLWELAAHGGDHAADWITVQLIVHPIRKTNGSPDEIIRSVFHFHHGDKSEFDMANQRSSQFLQNGQIKEYTQDATFDSEHTVQFYTTDNIQYIHPVVYVEWGGHEFWPNTHGSKQSAPNHNGEGHYHYLCHNIMNLGEVVHPSSKNAEIILRFNGPWGKFNIANNNPPGPTLHTEWQWPGNNKIGIPIGDFEN